MSKIKTNLTKKELATFTPKQQKEITFFVTFMKSKRTYTKWCRNVLDQKKNTPVQFFTWWYERYGETDSTDNFIFDSFIWGETVENNTFWRDLNVEYWEGVKNEKTKSND